MADLGAWLLVGCGVIVVGIGVFFIAFRPPLLPEDLRYIAAQQGALDASLPGLVRWLAKVFWVMGGYMIATGILTIDLALTGFRDGSTTAIVVAAAARGSHGSDNRRGQSQRRRGPEQVGCAARCVQLRGLAVCSRHD